MTMTARRPATASATRGKIWAAVAAVVMIAALGFAWSRPRSGSDTHVARPFEAGRFTRLTSTGNAFLAAISADGRYVVHIKIQSGSSGLWIRQTATTSDEQIVAPAAVRYDGVSYSPDGNYVYYVTYSRTGGVGTLYKVPILGGTPQRILEDVDSAVTFSPDGRQFAFMRGQPAEGRNYILIANEDGSGARRAGTVEPPDQLQLNSPSWSPDGRTIIASGQSLRDGPHAAVFALDLAGGTFKPVGGRWTSVGDVQWMPDGSAFVTTASEFGSGGAQIWEITFSAGERRRITNDLNRYQGASVSADARTLVTVQQESVSNLWVLPAGDLARGKQITSGRGRSDGLTGLAWTPDGRLVFGSGASGRPEIWIANADGSDARQLTNDADPSVQPAVSPDGQFIAFQRFKAAGMNIWRMALDGSDARPLTRTGTAFAPLVSADSRWVFFYTPAAGFPKTYKVSVDGGDPVKVSDDYFRPTGISPDGTRLLGAGWDARGRRSALAMMPTAGGPLTFVPDVPPGLPAWTPDGRSITYADMRDGSLVISNIPPAGGTSKPLVKLEDNVSALAWSRDGRLALARGTGTSDVVLIARSPIPDR